MYEFWGTHLCRHEKVLFLCLKLLTSRSLLDSICYREERGMWFLGCGIGHDRFSAINLCCFAFVCMLPTVVPISFIDLALEPAIIRTPLIAPPSLSIREAIARMSAARSTCLTQKSAMSPVELTQVEGRASCILAVENQKLVGILTERDVVRLSASQESLEGVTITSFMRSPVVTLAEKNLTSPFIAINLLQRHGIRHIPVLDQQDHVVGLLTHASLQQLLRPVDLLRLRLVSEVMTANVVCASPQQSILDVANLMAEHRVSSVVIVEKMHPPELERPIYIPLGIVTERDIVQFQALELNFEALNARMVMSSPVFAVGQEDSLWAVQQLMQQQMVKRLVVTGTYGELLGIVTQTSVLRALNPLDLYRLAEALEQKISQLEAEKVMLLQERNHELEKQVQKRTMALNAKVEREQVITKVATRIHSTLNVQEVLESSVQDVRSLLGCSHILICQFQPDWSVEVVAESHAEGQAPYLGDVIFDPCFAPNWVEPYLNGRVRVVADIETEEMTECHRQLTRDLNIRAKILVPIVQSEKQLQVSQDQVHGDKLWGLLSVIESDRTRQWTEDEVALVKQLTTQLAIAIQQATVYETAQHELVERQRIESDLRQSEQLYASLAEASPVGIFRTNARGECVYVNEQWTQMMGIPVDEVIGRHWGHGMDPDERDRVFSEWSQAIQNHEPLRVEFQLKKQDKVKFPRWVFAQVVAEQDLEGKLTGYIGTITDISDRKRAEQQLLHNALHDSLTDLPNRNLLMQRLEQSLKRIDQHPNCHFAVLFLDLDQFKIINDSLGHLVGDEVLLTMANTLTRIVGDTHLAARLGGDEFVILLENIHRIQDATRIAEDILTALGEPVQLQDREVFLSASIGIVWGTPAYSQSSDLIRDADIAMYKAKASGPGRYTVFDATMHAQVMKRLDLGNDLKKALDKQEFVVAYQPIVSLSNNHLLGFEALIRWQHPVRGFVSPGEFIPLAEETGLIVDLDRWMLYESCRQLAQWQQEFPQARSLKMGVNLSVQDLRRDSLINDISQMVLLSGIDYHCLNLEVTESMVMEDINSVIDILCQLREKDIQISIDDFGTGYSSLSYLHRLPANTLKIDRSFVSQMQNGGRNYQIVETIVALSKQLGLSTTAEGIETRQQLTWLQALGCEIGQGYLFARPLTTEGIRPLFQSDSLIVPPSD